MGGLASQIDAWAAASRYPSVWNLMPFKVASARALAASLPASLPLQSNPNRKGFSALRHRKEVTTGKEGRKEVRSEGADKNGVGAGNGPPSLPGVNCG